MGKGFNNYMCKKFFHPASADNLKRVWIAQKKSEVEKKAQDDLRRQYDREQELYQNKALLSKESKERLELNFMYEPPPGVKKIGEKDAEDEDGKEPEYKFEWQRTWGHAPKESYLQKGDEFNEQPFGIQVCQAKCIKCGKYGHMNTDKRCALYGKSLDHDAPIQNVDQERSSKAGGSHSLVEEERGVDRVEMLKNMSKEEKKKLLKKLKKMEKKDKKKSKKDKKKGRSKSESEEEEWEERGATVHHHHDKKSPKDEDKKSAKKNDTKRDEERSTERRRRDRSDSRDAARKERRRDRSDSREERKERRRDRSDSQEDRRERRRDRSDSRDGRRRERSRSSGGRKERRRSRDERRERPVSREERGKRERS